MISVGFGRQRRSGFKAFTNPRGGHSVLMRFEQTDLLAITPEKLNPNALHIVTSAILGIGVLKRPRTSHVQQHQTVTFTMYQLMEEAKTRPEAAISMATQSFQITELTNSIEFDATEMVQSWILDEEYNHGMRIECDNCHQVGLSFINDEVSMAIKIHSTNNQQMMTRRSSVLASSSPAAETTPPHVGHQDCSSTTHQAGKKRPRCCRESMKINLATIPGFDFIQQPRVFDAYLCRGRCPPRFNAANDHALLQSLMHLKTRRNDLAEDRIPRPCCVGTKYQPLDVLHVDDNDTSKLKVTHWKNIIASACGCS